MWWLSGLFLTGLSIEFATGVFTVWLNLRDINSIGTGLRKAGLEGKLMVGCQGCFRASGKCVEFIVLSNLSTAFMFECLVPNVKIDSFLVEKKDNYHHRMLFLYGEHCLTHMLRVLMKCHMVYLFQNLLPINKRTQENFEHHFKAAGLQPIVEYQVRTKSWDGFTNRQVI